MPNFDKLFFYTFGRGTRELQDFKVLLTKQTSFVKNLCTSEIIIHMSEDYRDRHCTVEGRTVSVL